MGDIHLTCHHCHDGYHPGKFAVLGETVTLPRLGEKFCCVGGNRLVMCIRCGRVYELYSDPDGLRHLRKVR